MSTEPDSSSLDDVEFNILKDYYKNLQDGSESGSFRKLDPQTLNSNVKIVLASSVTGNNKKAELALQILDHLYTNEYILDNESKLSGLVASNLDKGFFEKLLKVFQTDQGLSLKIVRILIKLLRTVLHQNLSIVNPLLQIMEMGFKHSSNQIKLEAYNCWGGLIANFALDKAFFFKSKKFNLILTPLINKCKAYKDEELCRTKANAWLSLVENINENMSQYVVQALLPFFNYCFGIVDKSLEQFETGNHKINKNAEFQTVDHTFKSLIQMGFELFVSLIHNGDLSQLDANLKQHFKYVNQDRYFKTKSSLSNTSTWLYVLKYFFEVILKSSSLDTDLVVYTWKKLYELLKLTPSTDRPRANVTKEMTEEQDEYEQKEFNELAEYFLRNTVEYVNNAQISNKNQDNKFLSQVVKHLLVALRAKENKYLFENQKFTKDLQTMFKKAANLFMSCTDEEEMETALDNLSSLLVLMDSQPAMIDLYNWLHISARFYDYMRHLKTKSTVYTISQRNSETVQMFLVFPFKYFSELDIQENDVKVVVNSLSNAVKSFGTLIKQNRIKLAEEPSQGGSLPKEDYTVNSWCIQLFVNLQAQQERTQQQMDYSSEDRLKVCYMLAQLNLYLLQNIFEFELINQQTESQTSDVFDSCANKSGGDSYIYFASLIESTNSLSKSLHNIILSTDNTQSTATVLKKDFTCDSPSVVENKQPIQIFCNLVELISVLFTRVKSHAILSQFLTNFAGSIELITELNSISKLTNNTEASPAAKKASRLSQINHHHHAVPIVNFQSTRHSADLCDKFSMQIASYIQNNLSKSYLNHQFDSEVLKTLEPIFYSFLKYSQKMNLKQKTLQAWNSTFGKSTVGSLSYSNRLEQLFVEIRDEMQNNTSRASTGGTGLNGGLIALSLPGFKLIDSLQTTNMTGSNFMNDEYLMNEEKENTPENSGAADAKKVEKKSLTTSKSKEFLNEASCSSVPVALLVSSIANTNTNKKETESPLSFAGKTTPIMEKTHKVISDQLSMSAPKNKKQQMDMFKEIQKNNSHSVTANFCFSGASGISSSTSKLGSNLMRTPDASNTSVRCSPRSLKNNHSKRKLDLNVLIDQMPDKDFIEIGNKSNKPDDMDVLNVLSKLDKSAERKKSQFKQPLTEHQKEVRRSQKKSFIPMEIQSVCCVLEPTMDSQMSCTNDTCDDSTTNSQMPIAKNLKFDFEEPELPVEPAKTTEASAKAAVSSSENNMDMSVTEPTPAIADKDEDEDYLIANMSSHMLNSSQAAAVAAPEAVTEKPPATEKSMEPITKINSFDTPSGSSTSNSPSKLAGTINFKSKIKPNKKIELFEVRNNATSDDSNLETHTLLEDVAKAVVVVDSTVSEPVLDEASVEPTVASNEEPVRAEAGEEKLPAMPETPNTRRRSTRLRRTAEEVAEIEMKAQTEAETSEKAALAADVVAAVATATEEVTSEMEHQPSSADNMGNNMSDLVDQIEQKISQESQSPETKEMSEEELFDKLNEEYRDIKEEEAGKLNLKSLRQKIHGKMRGKSSDVMGINHKSGTSKVSKMSTFKLQQERLKIAKKQKKISKKIQALKQGQKESESRSSRSNKRALVEELNRSLSEEALEVSMSENVSEPVEYKKNVYEFEDVKPESDASSDEDVPISSLVKRKTDAEAPSVVVTDLDVEKKMPVEAGVAPEDKKEQPKESVVLEKKPTRLDDIVEDAPSTPLSKQLNNSHSQLAKSLNTSPSTAALIHKSNGTPTTSILKKRLLESKVNHSASRKMINMSSSALFAEENGTPNKRRVSFCAEVQIEEIEPNFNKAFRSTPKPQNRAKLVLSSYFNNKQQVSSPVASSAVNAILSNNPAPSNTANQLPERTYEPKLNSSLNSATSNMSPKLNKMIPSRLSVGPDMSVPTSNLANNSTGSPSLNTPMSPGGSSLINSFLSNKQGFLSGRASIIQQQMVNNRTIPQNRSLSSPQVASTNSPLTPSSTPSRLSRVELTNNSSVAEGSTELYGKLKHCQANMEKINIDPDMLNKWFVGNWQKTLKMRDINTVGELCSMSSSDISSLPFKMPKLENFMGFIKKFEDLKESEQEIGTLTRDNKLTKLGSVEEEMDKLETSNLLNTSIESETLTDTNKVEVRVTRRSISKQKGVKQTAQNDNNVEMDVDMETGKKDNKISESPMKAKSELETMLSDMKSHINNETQKSPTSFCVDKNLTVRNVMQLLEHADTIESEILMELQQKLCRLAETRKKLRNHAQSLIN